MKTYAILRLVYLADHGMVRKAELSKCDRDIWRAAKRWLHLPPSTTDRVLYTNPKYGRLGLIKMAVHIPSIQLRRIKHPTESEDE